MDISLRRLFGKSETRSVEPTVSINYGQGKDGDETVYIDPTTLSSVITCTNKRASTIASLPLMIYKKTPDGIDEPQPNHPLSKLFAGSPYAGNEMSTVDWLHYQMLNYDYNGNAYAQIVRNNGGRIVELIPIPASNVSITRGADNRIIYNISGLINGKPTSLKLDVDSMLHVRNYSLDGLVGQSVISLAKESVFAAAVDMVNSSRRVAKNTSKVTNVLTTAADLTATQKTALAKNFNEASGTLVLTNGLTFADHKVNISPEDAQFLQSYSFKQSEIAAMFDIPAYMLNITSDRKPAASVEAEAIGFLTGCIRPICERWEAALNLRLLTETEREIYTFGFDETKLMRLDSTAQMNFMSKGIAAGLFTINEMRAIAGYPKIDGGDLLRTPLNLGPTDKNDQNQPQ